MKILVTGADGFVGTTLVKRLKQEGKEVSAAAENSNEFSVDLRNIKEVKSLIEKIQPTIVIHCGAYVDLSRTYMANKMYRC